MELKDVILSTLAEMDENHEPTSEERDKNIHYKPTREEKFFEPTHEENQSEISKKEPQRETGIESELMYLNSIRERLLVLFEGFQAPNNANIEAKVDMTLNFLEYTLATIDSRVQKLEKGKQL